MDVTPTRQGLSNSIMYHNDRSVNMGEPDIAFLPNRNCHMVIKDKCTSIIRKRIDYIVDADIKGFFDHMNHDWVLNFVGYYIQDPNILNLINKYLKAGIREEGEYKVSGLHILR